MVIGYFVADTVLYTITAGVLGIGTNILQGVVGAVVALVLIPALNRAVRLN